MVVSITLLSFFMEALGGVYSVEVWHRLERCSRLLGLFQFYDSGVQICSDEATVICHLQDLSPYLVSVFEVMYAPLPRFHRLGFLC
ncbi:unnamed protein product [Eruca vesicaria subsp. sativa]|uniref:Secreted protein n=1 Tax=Eruca vesicaria subsp. sativa TaxID=29727 RepID=A0ABC8LPF3_ERUVS|nr:unnamed protein product [Eruca vesicaria subsp. sativa]